MTADTEVLLHALWGKAVGAPGYDKKQWLALSEDIERYAQGGYKQSFDAIASLTHHAGFAGEIVDRVRCALTRLHSSQTQIATQATQLVELQEKLKGMEAAERGERVLVEAIHDATQGIDSMHIGHYPEAVRHLRRLYDVEKERADRNETALKRATRTLGVVCTPEQLPEYVARLFEANRCHSERANKAEAERDAYKRAKAENDDRYMGERDQARAEADALRAEVAALRGLPESDKALVSFMLAHRNDYSNEANAAASLVAALATVPPAKVADRLPTGDGAKVATDADVAELFAPKPGAAWLEPLARPYGYTPWQRAITDRVNELSAIAKRGGL